MSKLRAYDEIYLRPTVPSLYRQSLQLTLFYFLHLQHLLSSKHNCCRSGPGGMRERQKLCMGYIRFGMGYMSGFASLLTGHALLPSTGEK